MLLLSINESLIRLLMLRVSHLPDSFSILPFEQRPSDLTPFTGGTCPEQSRPEAWPRQVVRAKLQIGRLRMAHCLSFCFSRYYAHAPKSSDVFCCCIPLRLGNRFNSA